MEVRVTLIGGPTLLLEVAGLRILTDPTFDAPGSYTTGAVTLTKTTGPALDIDAITPIDVVLLSHAHHADNLDHAGRALLAHVPTVFTTMAGAARLGGHVRGLAPWEVFELPTPTGQVLRATATPARHGPAGIEPLVGEVIGFVLTLEGAPDHAIYLTGDTTYFSGVAEVARRFPITLVVPFVGAARTRGPFYLTMNTNDAIETASVCPQAPVMPIHCDSWAHFTQSQADVALAFGAVGLTERLILLAAGQTLTVVW